MTINFEREDEKYFRGYIQDLNFTRLHDGNRYIVRLTVPKRRRGATRVRRGNQNL
ncbi:MAG: hypothetical protein QW514_09395 [Thermoprotei archaeon]